jgi:Papain family cysteine protease
VAGRQPKPARSTAQKSKRRSTKRLSKLDVNRDSMDFRDLIYRPALLPLKPRLIPARKRLRILDQQNEGACTGFGLAAVVDSLVLERGRRERVSPRMLFEMAKRHDQWPGQSYDYSSARGAMKGWHKNGVCSEKAWPYDPKQPGFLTEARQQDALAVRLGAYYRIMPRRSDLHAALNEVGAVFASAAVHEGWDEPKRGVIGFDASFHEEGGHAFAIVGYTARGFLVQNSWGPDWGGFPIGQRRLPGVALWTYDDFERNVWDLWVARLALPLEPDAPPAASKYTISATGTRLSTSGPPRFTIRDHFLHIDDGHYDPKGDYPSSRAEAEDILRRAVMGAAGDAPPAHLLLYAHGGLNDIKDAARRVGKWRGVFRDNGIHELHFIWETGLLAELRDLLLGKQSFAEERVGAASDWWDRILERVTHPVGHALWKEMQSDAELAFQAARADQEERAGTHALRTLRDLLAALPAAKRPKLHLVGHSAGSIWHAHLLERWSQLAGAPFENLILFAPACTHGLFERAIRPALAERRVRQLHHFLLDDQTEQGDDVAKVYRKSLLYLVSNAYQRRGAVEPILGMEKFLAALPTVGVANRITTYRSPHDPKLSASRSHGGFDQDEASMNTMLALVLDGEPRRRFKAPDLDD